MVKTDKKEPHASEQEIVKAIEQLSPDDQRRLTLTARKLVQGIGKKAFGFEETDLLQEAITRTLDGRRRWCKDDVTFCRHIYGVMKSVASHWWESEAGAKVIREADCCNGSEVARDKNPLLLVEAPNSDPERKVVEEDFIAKLMQKAASRELAPMILEGMLEGMTGKEIRELGITQTQYETEMKWIRRNL